MGFFQFLRAKDGVKVESGLRRKRMVAAPRYSSKIIKAGAVLQDTKALLNVWDTGLSVRDNLQQVRRRNLLGKPSRSRVDDILAILRQRYVAEEQVLRALATMVKRGCNGGGVDRILYFHAAQSDALLRDVVIELLWPQWARGVMEVNAREIESALQTWVQQGKTSGRWGGRQPSAASLRVYSRRCAILACSRERARSASRQLICPRRASRM